MGKWVLGWEMCTGRVEIELGNVCWEMGQIGNKKELEMGVQDKHEGLKGRPSGLEGVRNG